MAWKIFNHLPAEMKALDERSPAMNNPGKTSYKGERLRQAYYSSEEVFEGDIGVS